MKELYTSPELHVSCFAPIERLAANISFDDLLTLAGNKQDPVNPSNEDIPMEIVLD